MNKIEAENRGLEQDMFDLMCNLWDSQICHQTMGLKITYLGPGIAGMKKIPNIKFSTEGGRVHGGVLATLADTVMGVAAATINGQVYRTVDMNINYFAPAFEANELTAEGLVIHPGNTIAVVEGSLFNNEGKLIAKSRGTFIRDNKHRLSEER